MKNEVGDAVESPTTQHKYKVRTQICALTNSDRVIFFKTPLLMEKLQCLPKGNRNQSAYLYSDPLGLKGLTTPVHECAFKNIVAMNVGFFY